MRAQRKHSMMVLLHALVFFLGTSTAQAATYYVATTGSDSNPGTLQQPFRTIVKGVSVLRPGDTTFVRGGTYAEIIDTNQFNFPSGTSWTNAVTISAFQGETVIIQPNAGGEVLNLAGEADQYIIFDGIRFDAINTGITAISINQGSNHIRFQNCEIKNAYRSGVYILWGNNNGLPSNYNEFINCEIHHNGRQGYTTGAPDQPPGLGAGHGIYITTQYNVFRGNRVHHNGNWGLHLYSANAQAQGQTTMNNLIEQNLVSENGGNTTRYGGACCGGIVMSSGTANEVKNNLVYNNPVIGISVEASCSACKVYNNTVYNNAALDIQALTGGSGQIQNNIAFPKGVSIAGGYTSSNNLTTNPNFVDAASNNFRLLSSSTAIDAGITLSAVPVDFSLGRRPQGSAYDIGAYEFGGGTGSMISPPRNLRVQ
jgi:parallel beta-helix repeat protein